MRRHGGFAREILCSAARDVFGVVVALLVLSGACRLVSGADEPVIGLADGWTKSSLGGARESFVLHGTRDRNNPLRRKLKEPFSGSQIFVHFRLKYDAGSIDSANLDAARPGDGEFFILWLDAVDGGDRAAHHGGIPNVGVHVDDQANRFMVRYQSSQQQFSKVELVGDRDYQVVVRLSKSEVGADQPFDRLAVWLDPLPHQLPTPAAQANSRRSITEVQWIGFATGMKTETSDAITVSDIRVANSWTEILGLPQPRAVKNEPPPTQRPLEMPQTVDFAAQVYPILKQHCFRCHAADAGTDSVPSKGANVRLDVLDELLNHVTPRDAAASRLIALIRSSDEDEQMPPAGETRLNEQQIATLATWIDEGLAWDEEMLPTPQPQTDHWAFQPIVRPAVPAVNNRDWVRTSVDAFIARRHEQAGIAPVELAAESALLRRLALDLTGLPPDAHVPDQDQFDAQNQSATDLQARADALVEQLLATAAYGERWGRHWLDLARWAESNGHQHNRHRPHAWRYRDYVIRSFQDDKPFDRFILEQLAGDELPYAEEHLVATGFLSAARYSGNELDHAIQRNDILVDVVNTTAQALLGITMECAQCHTHKFDPLSIRDYYRWQAFFSSGQPGNVILQSDSAESRLLVDARWGLYDSVHARLVEQRRARGYPEPILVTPKSVRGAMRGAERDLFVRMETEIANLPQAWSWSSPYSNPHPPAVAPHEMRWPLPRLDQNIPPPKTYLRIRGDVNAVGPEVQPGWPAVFGETPASLDRPRTALAVWITSNSNPLTARVWANRVWQWHFGKGLVATSGDFGTQGVRPSHPELLDWLASELIDSGWSTKHLHRLILNSNTFRQASAFSPANHQLDPENELLWRWSPRRLEAEAIRDNVLAVAGVLDTKLGGPSVPPAQVTRSRRRSVYLHQRRDQQAEVLTVFDSPAAITTCSRRQVSTVSLQPLYLLNSPFMQTMASDLAGRVRRAAAEPEQQIPAAFRITLGRPPEDEEIKRATEYLKNNSLEALCHAMLNLNEFLYSN